MSIHTIIHSDTSPIQKLYKSHNNTQNNTNKACQVTKHGKLALFAQYCYIDGGRNGRDHPNIEILIQKLSSRGAGDQHANPVLSRLTTPFGRAALVTTAMLAMPLAAYAQDNSNTATAPTNIASTEYVIPTNTSGEAQIYNVASTTIAPTPQQEVWQDALEYSRNNAELVIVVYGHTAKYTPEQLGAGFQRVFKDQQGITTTSVWVANPEQKGAKVMFFVDGALTSDNILNLKDVMPHIPEAADMFKEHAPTMRRRLASLDGTATSFASLDVNQN